MMGRLIRDIINSAMPAADLADDFLVEVVMTAGEVRVAVKSLEIDYKELLSKYICHVGCNEGIDFITGHHRYEKDTSVPAGVRAVKTKERIVMEWPGRHGDNMFTEKEWVELGQIAMSKGG